MFIIQKKICLLGEFAVGKTSLIRQFIEGRFDDRYLSTIGVKVSRKSLDQGSYRLNLLIWDIAGPNEFTQTPTSYLQGTAAALLVCDLTRPETVNSLPFLASLLQQHSPQAHLLILGNKADLTAERAIPDTQLTAVAHTCGCPSLLTSAKTGAGVNEAFHHLAQQFPEVVP